LSFLVKLESTSLTYTDTELTNDVTYYYKISAVNAAGEGANTTALSATPMTTVHPKGFLEEFWWVLLVIALIIVLAIIALIILFRRKEKEIEEPEGVITTLEEPKGKMPSPETIEAAKKVEADMIAPSSPKPQRYVSKPIQRVYKKRKVVEKKPGEPEADEKKNEK